MYIEMRILYFLIKIKENLRDFFLENKVAKQDTGSKFDM